MGSPAASLAEKVEAIPDTPEISTNTGVIQQRDAAIIESTPAPANLPALLAGELLFLFKLFPFLRYS